jgi:hypothetical protein
LWLAIGQLDAAADFDRDIVRKILLPTWHKKADAARDRIGKFALSNMADTNESEELSRL